MRITCVVLTTGDRPRGLSAAIASVRRQRTVDVDVVVVHNAPAPLTPSPAADGTQVVEPGANVGIPAGRNLGVARASGELVLFLDDDAVLAGDDVLELAAARFAADPSLGAISMRILDPVTGSTERRHVPRLRVGDPARRSWVTTFLGGASIVRRAAYDRCGGLPEPFFYAHEEISLAWRMIDRGYRILYDPALVVHHPGLPPSRHHHYHEFTARNRVLLARMHLPLPVAVPYLTTWSMVTMVRARNGRRASLVGFVAGFRQQDVPREPIGWRTVWRLTRYGRPPVV